MDADKPTDRTHRQGKVDADQGEQDQTLIVPPRQLQRTGLAVLPALIADAGEAAVRRTVEFFTVNIRNKNTRLAYARAVGAFCAWCEERGLTLETVLPIHV